MASFDLGPTIKGGYKEFVVRPAFWSVPMVLVAFYAGKAVFASSFIYGIIIGLLDTVIYIAGVKKAMPYSHDPQKGLRIMHRYRWYRIFSISSLLVLLLRRGFDVMGTCVGLLLIHIFSIINLTIIAYRMNKAGTRRKE